MDAIIEELRQKPNLKSLVDELNQIIEDEDKKRNDFIIAFRKTIKLNLSTEKSSCIRL